MSYWFLSHAGILDTKRTEFIMKGWKDMTKRLSLVLAFALLAAFSIGCAHDSALFSSLASADTSSHQNQEIKSSAVDQTPPKQDEVGQELPDDDLDFLDEEDEEETVEVADPFYYWNKAMYHFNDKFYFWILKPVARGYKWAVPKPVRTGVRNFFHNLSFPIRFVSCILQARGKAALSEVGRFVVNSTAGVLGFGNPAKKYQKLNPSEEDLGQTFGRWGFGNGFYIVWPLLGPSTLRDSVGFVGEIFLDPVRYVDPTETSMAITAYDAVNETSFKIGDYESLKEAAIDPYVSIRDAYIQNRKKKVEE